MHHSHYSAILVLQCFLGCKSVDCKTSLAEYGGEGGGGAGGGGRGGGGGAEGVHGRSSYLSD